MSTREERKTLLSETLRLEYEHQMFKARLVSMPLDFERMAELVMVANESNSAAERIAGLMEARDLARAAARQSFNASTRWADEDTHEFAVYEAEGIALSRHADALDARIAALTNGKR